MNNPIFNTIFQKIQQRKFWVPSAIASISLISFLIFVKKNYHKMVVFPNIEGRKLANNPKQYQHPRFQGFQSNQLQITTKDNIKLRGWHIHQKNADKIIVYFHQNAGNIGSRLYFIKKAMKNMNANFVIVAYRGFSESDGQQIPKQSEILIDSEAILEKSIEISRETKLPLFVYGKSLGGAVSIYACGRRDFKQQIRGLIIENTFTKLFDVAVSISPFPISLLVRILGIMVIRNAWNSIERVKCLRLPVFLIKSCRDQLIPKRQMDELEKQCKRSKIHTLSYEIKEGDHNGSWQVNPVQYFQHFNHFMNRCIQPKW